MGDLLYQGSCSGVFYAFDRLTGEVRWAHDTAPDGEPASFHGDPLVHGGLILTGSDAPNLGHLYAFELETGAVRWKRAFGRGVPSDVLRHGENLLTITMGGDVLCLDVKTGEKRWIHELPTEGEGRSHLRSSLLLQGDRLYVALGNGTVRAHDASSGTVHWELDLGSPANASLARIDGSLYVGTLDNALLRLDAMTGEVLGARSTTHMPFGRLVPHDGGLLALLDSGKLVRLDAELGAVAWESTTGKWSSFRPLVVGDAVIVGSEEGELRAVRLRDGETAWTTTLEGTLRGLGFADGIYYVGTLQGKLHAYRP